MYTTDKFIGKQIKANEPTWILKFMQISSFEISSHVFSKLPLIFSTIIIFHYQSMVSLVDLVEMCAIALKYNLVKLQIISGFYKFSDIIHFINFALFTVI